MTIAAAPDSPAPPTRSTFAPAPPEVIAAVAAIVRERGERGAFQLFEFSRLTLARVLGGLGVRAGTLALVRERLAAVKADTKGPDAQ